MCMHDGLNEECPGRNCPCPCDNCVLSMSDVEANDAIDFEEVQPGVWKVAEKDQGRMNEMLDDALKQAFGKNISELFPDA